MFSVAVGLMATIALFIAIPLTQKLADFSNRSAAAPPEFTVEVRVDGGPTERGIARSKKLAEQEAARLALEALDLDRRGTLIPARTGCDDGGSRGSQSRPGHGGHDRIAEAARRPTGRARQGEVGRDLEQVVHERAAGRTGQPVRLEGEALAVVEVVEGGSGC